MLPQRYAEENYALIIIVIIPMLFITFMSLLMGNIGFVIYMAWMIACLCILFYLVVHMDPKNVWIPFTVVFIAIILIAGHVVFNATIYFEPVPHSYGNTFCMKSVTNADGSTSYVDASFGLPVTHIYIPLTKIHIYNPGKTTYYPDRSKRCGDDSPVDYQVVSKNGALMDVTLCWDLSDFCDPDNPSECGYLNYHNTESNLYRLFDKRGPNWEERYAKSIITEQMARDFASTRTFQSLETPSWDDIDASQFDVKTNDFEGYISMSFKLTDANFRECYFENKVANTGPSSVDNDPIYGEPGEAPTYPNDKCAPYTSKYTSVDPIPEDEVVYSDLNRG